MAQRSIWKGTMSFGAAVVIPVKLYSATDEEKVSFHQIHRECKTRIKMPKWCPTCDHEVQAGDIVKGYPIGKDDHVLLEDADFDTLPISTLKAIELLDFVDPSMIDPRQVNKSYFLVPDAAGAKAFSLVVKALQKEGKVAISKIAFREKEQLAAVRPFGEVMLLQTLYYVSDLRPAADIAVKLPDVSQREIDMGVMLIQTLQQNHPISSYTNEYNDALMQVISAKQSGTVLVVEKPKEAPPARDLVDALMASMKSAEEAKKQDKTVVPLADQFKEIESSKIPCPECDYKAWSQTDLDNHRSFAHAKVAK